MVCVLLNVHPMSVMHRFFPGLVVVAALASVGCGASMNASRHGAPSATSPLKDPALLLEQGDAFAAAGDHTRAQQYYAAAIAAGGKSAAILPRLLNACVASGDIRLASEYAATELSRNPDDAHLRFLTGALHARIGDRVAARKYLVQAAQDLPQDAKVQFSVATFFRDDLSDKVEADPYFREYLRLAPRGEHAQEARASLMERVQ